MYGITTFNEISISAHNYGNPPSCTPPILFPQNISEGFFAASTDTPIIVTAYFQNDGLLHFSCFNTSNSSKKISKIYWYGLIVV